ncbi:MAG: FIST C-terminal domain-containing protein [Candidatus Omnitrophica bacterium]|nr:FIST C-terminal domain-containing protein [Candidatus Omnitrophota bacterium]
MNKEVFAIAFSERKQAEAIKEISLKIKLIFPKEINYLILLFTPDYNPKNLLKTISLTLKPKKILGLTSPFLIFEGKVISKGVVACCVNKDGMELQETFSKATNPQETELFLASSFRKLKKGDFAFLSFISSKVNPNDYIRGVKMSLGKFPNILGSGFTKQYSLHNSQIINNTIDDGLVNIAIKGLTIRSLRLGGYVPLGKPFIITKTTSNRDIILEINNQPAINIYKHYLQEKFDTFIKNHLFSFYPLGININDSLKLITIIDCLEDGSLICMGKIRKKESGHIMLLDSSLLIENLKRKLSPLRNNGQTLTFIINSLTRKKTLGEDAKKEISAIKKTLGDKSKVIGLYADYSFFSDREEENIDIEAGNLIVTMWE